MGLARTRGARREPLSGGGGLGRSGRRNAIWRWRLLLGFVLAVFSAVAVAAHVALIEIQGPIGPATSAYFAKAQQQASEQGAVAIVLRLDTPGGLDTAMRDIIRVVLASELPVIGWVGPGGARAASAGTYILYACHVAAMAPATNLGAATPVPVGGSWPTPKPQKGPDGNADAERGESANPEPEPAKAKDAESEEAAAQAGQIKAVNDAAAYLRGLAEKRGRNADWAEAAVREGASLSAEQALESKVVDLLASDPESLLRLIDGRVVTTAAGEIKLATAALGVQVIAPDWRMRLLAVLTNPTVAYILMLIGIYGLLLEGYHPGAILPGVVGAICLLIALYAFQLLPVNYVGLGLILLGIALMVAEALAPSFGVLGFGGASAFVLGSVLLMDIDVPGYGINLGLIAGIALSATALLAVTLYLLWRSRRVPVTTGADSLLGQTVRALDAIVGNQEGWAELGGERWRVRSQRPLRLGQRARVTGRDGLRLDVEPIGD